MLRSETVLEVLWSLRHTGVDSAVLRELWSELVREKPINEVFRLFRDWKPYRLGSGAFQGVLKEASGRDFVKFVVERASEGSREALRLLDEAKLVDELTWALLSSQSSEELMREVDFFIVVNRVVDEVSESSRVNILARPEDIAEETEELRRLKSRVQSEPTSSDRLFFFLVEIFERLKRLKVKAKNVYIRSRKLPKLRSLIEPEALALAAAAAAGLIRLSEWREARCPSTDLSLLLLLKKGIRVLPEERTLRLSERVGLKLLAEEADLKALPRELQIRALRRSSASSRIL